MVGLRLPFQRSHSGQYKYHDLEEDEQNDNHRSDPSAKKEHDQIEDDRTVLREKLDYLERMRKERQQEEHRKRFLDHERRKEIQSKNQRWKKHAALTTVVFKKNETMKQLEKS
jgi:DNA segregation ATPase FtsK/SpoIIIE-like protein